ncbi:MAG: hypothetical protein MJZ67_01890 [Bacteroidales bacterium]|nr:hypothetical protein [Bacteroidales bacterium]
MLHPDTLNEIRESRLKCVEYEIGLFLCLLTNPDEIEAVINAASTRDDYKKILGIANSANKEAILNILSYAGMSFLDVSFESQNDDVGPADVIVYAVNRHGENKKIGLSIKYDNDVICNYTGRDILTEEQIANLQERLPEFANRYLNEMIERFGTFDEWYRIRFETKQKIASVVTNEYIDIVRDAVVERWAIMSQEEKDEFLYKVYRTDSPLDYWIYSFQKKGQFVLCTNPPYIRKSAYPRVTIKKIAGQYLGFFLDGQLLGKTQVKFNNGIFERYTSKPYKDAIEAGNIELANSIFAQYEVQGKGIMVQGKPLKYGVPFSSWNFEISY